MTREEAIEVIEDIIIDVRRTTAEEDKALRMAIEALLSVPNCQKCAIKELWVATEQEDLVQVVRCKDCDNFDYTFNYCNFLDAGVEGEDFFCAYGERREK